MTLCLSEPYRSSRGEVEGSASKKWKKMIFLPVALVLVVFVAGCLSRPGDENPDLDLKLVHVVSFHIEA